jgi:hypothetical protein
MFLDMTNTAYFLRPTIVFDTTGPSVSCYENAYLGDYEYAKDEYGDNLFLLYSTELLSEDLKVKLEAHPQFVTTYQPTDGKSMFVYKFDEQTKKTVVKQVMEGKYSEVNRDYVESNYPLSSSKLVTNRMVFDKHERLKHMWEERIGTALPDNAEVWSKPRKQDEMYRYPSLDGDMIFDIQ